MNARTKRAFVLALTCLLCPSAAQAQIGKGWLERLSGPGPFTGLTVELRFLCLTSGGDDAAEISRRIEESPGGRVTVPLGEASRAWLSPAGCHFLPSPDRPRVEIGVQYSGLTSRDNVLNYSDRPGLSQADLEVDLSTFMLTADIRVNRVLDVGAAIGRARFSSDADLFNSFTRTMYQPMRLTTRPLLALWDDHRAGILMIQFDGTRFKGGFRAEDFGAVPGTYREPGEMNWTWAAKVDLTTLLWR